MEKFALTKAAAQVLSQPNLDISATPLSSL
jgi:hypothetical protein